MAESEKLSKNSLKKLEKERLKLERKAAKLELVDSNIKEKQAVEDYAKDNYGSLPLNQSQSRSGRKLIAIDEITSNLDTDFWVRARIQTARIQGKKLCFLLLRQRYSTIQAIVMQNQDTVSQEMVKWSANLHNESIVLINAIVKSSPEPIKSATISQLELRINKIFCTTNVPEKTAFRVADASFSEMVASSADELALANLDTRLNNRVLDLRNITNQAIFELHHGLCSLFRSFLTNHKFKEIHTPKMIASASEGGSNVFKLQYFKTDGYLAQSPQLYKQMMIASDFERVYEIGPVFRAEDSNTYRHMTEFTGVDLEMALEEHYHEAMEFIEDMFIYIFFNLARDYAKQIDIVRLQYPVSPLLLPVDGKRVRLTFKEAIQLLKEAGWRKQRSSSIVTNSVEEESKYVENIELDDLNTREEKMLGSIIREKYLTDFYVIDKFPLAVRAFYTMPDPLNVPYSNSFDFFIRGEEILSGAQRIHDADLLVSRLNELKVPIKGLEDYIEAFRIGAPPHAGGGIGLERVLMFYLGLPNIRLVSAFPRDPKRLSP